MPHLPLTKAYKGRFFGLKMCSDELSRSNRIGKVKFMFLELRFRQNGIGVPNPRFERETELCQTKTSLFVFKPEKNLPL